MVAARVLLTAQFAAVVAGDRSSGASRQAAEDGAHEMFDGLGRLALRERRQRQVRHALAKGQEMAAFGAEL